MAFNMAVITLASEFLLQSRRMSVAFTAAPLLLVPITWIARLAIILLFICIRHFCYTRRKNGYSRFAYALSLTLLVLFTIAAISTRSTIDYVVNQAEITIRNLTTVSKYLSAAKMVEVDQFSLSPSFTNSISRVEKMINASSIVLKRETNKNSHKIQSSLDSLRLTLLILAALLLLLAFIGLLFSILGMETALYMLALIGWILGIFAFILCCFFILFYNVVGDTCAAMEEWVQNPIAHTSLDDILYHDTAQEIFRQSKNVTFQGVGIVDLFITTVSTVDPPVNLQPKPEVVYYNQSGQRVPVLCNPFNADLTDRTYAATEVDLDKASQEWRKHICQVSRTGTCTSTGRLTPEIYMQMVSIANVSNILYRYSPFLVDLVDCSSVRETFSVIIKHHCSGLRLYTKLVFIALIMVSVASMTLLIVWVFYTRQRRHRLVAKEFIMLSPEQHE
ncbi:hypothetical protein K2173_009515 [Erythroxylum novogranatense]|uniref:Uncharacterized protein n=1 Tax=Erythroxylum novogranatense TaxID=1862640 RepID=A0AAV8U7D0_9ROSI|nr:hypothetical protein K2173_009515 [Erythroxylum novogranatense]